MFFKTVELELEKDRKIWKKIVSCKSNCLASEVPVVYFLLCGSPEKLGTPGPVLIPKFQSLLSTSSKVHCLLV